MGWFSKLFGGSSSSATSTPPPTFSSHPSARPTRAHVRPAATPGYVPPAPAGRTLAVLAGDQEAIEVAGESYYDRAAWDVMHQVDGFFTETGAEIRVVPGGDPCIALVPAPANPFDANAVAVYADGHHVGYLPAEIASHWHSSLRQATWAGWMVTVPGRMWARSRGGGQVSTRVNLRLPSHGSPWPTNTYPSDEFHALDSAQTRKVAEAKSFQRELGPWAGRNVIVELREAASGKIDCHLDDIRVGSLTKASSDKLRPEFGRAPRCFAGGFVRDRGEGILQLEVRA